MKKPAPKVLITGKNGFVATNTREYLNANGYEVRGIDRYTLADPMKFQLEINTFIPDYIIHTAAYGNHYDQQDDYEILGANVVLLQFLLESTKHLNYKAFINLSSSSVYGAKTDPMKETDLPETNTMYGATKLAGEYLCKAYAKKYRLPIISTRLFSVFGKGEAEHRFIPRIMNSIQKGESLPLDPSPRHDWVYVEDVAEAFLYIMRNPISGEIYNICTGQEWSNEQVVERVEWIMDKCCRVNFTSSQRVFDVPHWVGDNSKLRSLGWIPKYDLMKGLRKTVHAYDREHKE